LTTTIPFDIGYYGEILSILNKIYIR